MEGGEEGGANGSLINFNDYILTLISSDLRLFAAQLSPSSRLNRNETDPQETETGDRRQPAPTRTNPRQPAPNRAKPRQSASTRVHPRPPASTRAHPRPPAPNRAKPRQSAPIRRTPRGYCNREKYRRSSDGIGEIGRLVAMATDHRHRQRRGLKWRQITAQWDGDASATATPIHLHFC